MPKQLAEPKEYCIRVSLGKNSREQVDEFCSHLEQDPEGRCKRNLCVYHVGKKKNNPHCHMVVTAFMTDPTLRKELKKFVEPGSFSIKTSDGDIKASTYLFHECVRGKHKCLPGDIICKCCIRNHNVSEKEIAELKELARQFSKCDSKFVMIKEVVNQYEEFQKENRYWSRHKCLFILILNYYDKEWVPSKFQMERYVTTAERELARLERPTLKDWSERIYQWYTGDAGF